MTTRRRCQVSDGPAVASVTRRVGDYCSCPPLGSGSPGQGSSVGASAVIGGREISTAGTGDPVCPGAAVAAAAESPAGDANRVQDGHVPEGFDDLVAAAAELFSEEA